MKAAVASSDGIVINQHFGRADTFYIYTKTGQGYVLEEKRYGIPFCHAGSHDNGDLENAVDLLADCEKVFVRQIGKGAREELEKRNIEAVAVPGIIAEVLEKYG